MGISKHASYLIPSSAIAGVQKLTRGGGGELLLAKIMDPKLQKKFGDTVIQKVVFVKNTASQEAFFQEVGIMIMMSSFPHFCQIIGYTESPLSIILKFYPQGSLSGWLRKSASGSQFALKVLRELAEALRTMHSHYLAHCDVKPDNVLMQVDNGLPSCYLTDFGITQILSEEILASKSFNVINLRGLSVHYASPEAFANFRSKKYSRTDFTKYDIYSFACVIYEVQTRKMPWH
jgi:serine/threonine protein kinase